MKERKNIDRLFQEQLKDFEASPDEQVWQNIASELHKDKRKKRIIPFWWMYSGVAALVVVGFFIFNTYKNQTILPVDNPVVIQEIPEKIRSIPEQNNLKNKALPHTLTEKNTANKTQKTTVSTVETVAITSTHTNGNSNYKNTSPSLSTPTQITAIKQEVPLKNNPFETLEPTTEKGIENNNKTQNDIATTNLNDVVKSPEETNPLEEILNEKTQKRNDLASNNKGKWQITPNVAPVYLQANSGGSAIDNQFSNNEKSGESSLSYGLGVRYAVNSKIMLRTGINKVVLGYNTNDVVYTPGLASNSIASINYNSANSAVEVTNQESFNSLSAVEKNIQKTENGAINQKMGYYEMPLEISYALLDKKIGISLIGGFSTLFLDENKISLVSSNSNVELGEANNLSKVHLSSNFGVGFKYQLVPSLHFHFEPTVKYQWNTFSSNANNFKPVFLGLYSGVSYRF
ncbi:hypothetical protein [Flavobacterium sp. UMI-01]|uniref:hypothetical protein n=1 Tax=Flavobacterium sp. UMI-01 TaxID=1441053 RepID=UPI001C7CAF64|nr:hypothetical protein [Flavobacterium sp. UMI-01]GIZ08071.1 hypothetical protein FUMI01_07980 [Flavobacterium sp. UMI-01]